MNASDVLWSVDELIAHCAHDDEGVRSWAVERVGVRRNPAAVAAIVGALADSRPRVLMSALKSVDACGDTVTLDALREPLWRVVRDEALPPGPREGSLRILLSKRDADAVEAVADRCRRADSSSLAWCRLLATHAPERTLALAAELDLLAQPDRGHADLVTVLPRVVSLDELPAVYAGLRSLDGSEACEFLAFELTRRCLADGAFVRAPASSESFESILAERGASFIYESTDASVQRWLSPTVFAPLLDATAGNRWREAITWCGGWYAAVADDDAPGAWGRALIRLLTAEAEPDERHARLAAALAITAGEQSVGREFPFEVCLVDEQFARACDAPELARDALWAAVVASWRSLPEVDEGRDAVSEELENILNGRDEVALTRAVELAARLPGLDVPGSLLDEVPELDADCTDALIRCLAAQPASLRELAPEALAGDVESVQHVVLEALGAQTGRWAGALIGEHFDRLLTHGSGEFLFDAVEQLGDVSLLPRVVAAWRPGEALAALTATRLAYLAGQESTLPPELRRDADKANTARRDLLARALSAGGLDELTAAIDEQPLSVDLVCNQCKRAARYDTGTATVHPDLERCKREGWDGVVFERVIVCKYCGAEDDYTLGPTALFSIMAGSLKAMMEGRAPTLDDLDNARVRVGVPGLSDGTHIRRASDGLRHWEKKLARNPGDADAWLRLGNLQRTQDRVDAAVDSYRRSIALRPTHVETLGGLLETLLEAGRGDEASELPGKILAALPRSGATPSVRAAVAALVAEFARLAVGDGQALGLMASWPGGGTKKQVEVNVSSLDLRRVTRWDRLAEFIAHPAVLMTSLKNAEPADVGSRLERLIENDGPLGLGNGAHGLAPSGTPTIARSAPKIGRNDPCHCGSGKKYKKCHG